MKPNELPQTSTALPSRHPFRLLGSLPFLLGVLLGITRLSGQTSSDTNSPAPPTYSPLLLFTNTGGKVVPLHDGQMLKVGRRYVLAAVPNPGFAFTNWTLVYAYTFATVYIDESGAQGTNFSTVLSPVPDYSTYRVIKFTNQAPEVIFDPPGTKITRAIGWQPEFLPRRRHGSITNAALQ